MTGRLVHGAEGLREAGGPRLELHEVPLEQPRPLHGDGGKVCRRPLFGVGVSPGAERRRGGPIHGDRRLHPLPTVHRFEFKLDSVDDIEAEAAQLRAAAEARAMKLPVNRRVDERHRVVTADGLSVWYTIQVSPHSRSQEVIFERSDRTPSDQDCHPSLPPLILPSPPAHPPSPPPPPTPPPPPSPP